ncbi:MAG TPA: redoxin domain-containing protein, partial [Planctomycetaceae bacterium]|nr:redoxin domain-containing protein [Planctomycetaceae bacterium]
MLRLAITVLVCSSYVANNVSHAVEARPQDRLGRVISDTTLTDFRGASVSLADFRDKPVIVLAFLGTECPLAKLAVTKLNVLSKGFEPRGVAILGINSNRQDSLAELATQAKEQAIVF